MDGVNWQALLGWALAIVIMVKIENAFRKLQGELLELRGSAKELARLTLSMDKRLWELEGRQPFGDTTERQFLERLGL